MGLPEAGEEVEGGVGGAGDAVCPDVERSLAKLGGDHVVRATAEELVGDCGYGVAGAMAVQGVGEPLRPTQRCVQREESGRRGGGGVGGWLLFCSAARLGYPG
jgi:hypothetical protein